MRKLAILMAAILTLNLVAPAASVHAAPTDTVTESIDEGNASGNGPSASSNDPNVSGNNPGNDPSTSGNDPGDTPGNDSGNDPIEPGDNPNVSNNDPNVSNNDPNVSGNDPSASGNEPNVSENDPSVSENEPEEDSLYVQEIYYKTSKGYPLVATFELPIEATAGEMYQQQYSILSLKLSVDGGEAKDLEVSKTQYGLNGIVNPETARYQSLSIGFNAGYNKDYNLTISEGVHTLSYEMELQCLEKTYTVSGSKEAEFKDDSKTKEIAFSTYTQYMSANKGSKVRSVYAYLSVPAQDEKISSLKFVNHDTKAAISCEVLDKSFAGGYPRADFRYTEMGGISAYSLFNSDVYSASFYANIRLKTDIPEGDYDIIFTTSKGKKYIQENAYRATKKAVVFSVDDTTVGYKNYETPCTKVYSDNTGDYVSVFVYGLNITKDTIPVFYADDSVEVLSEYLADDPKCGYEGYENGFDYTVKKRNPLRGEWNSSRLVKLTGDVIYVYNSSVEEREIRYYNANTKSTKEYEWNTSAETFRVYLYGKNVSENEIISVSVYKDWLEDSNATVETKVQYDGSAYYLEFDKNSPVYRAVKEQYQRLEYTIEAGENKFTYSLWLYGITEPKVSKNISVPANHTWEVHAECDVANVIYSGKTSVKKNVLTASQVTELADNGLYRVCIYNASGKLVDRYNTYFKGEQLYNITYELNGGENHPDNPSKYGKSETVTLLEPTKANHAFKGWYSDSGLTKKVTKIEKGSTGDKKFYAKWTPYTYSIAYNANGGTGKVKSTACTYDVETSVAKNTFERTGYVFAEWNTAKDGSGTSYTEEQKVINLSSENKAVFKLYAIWEPIKYTIVLDKNADDAGDGTVNAFANSFEVAYDDTFTLSGEEYIRTGYEITSWKTDAGKKISNGDVSNLTSVSGNTVTLSAQWEVAKYTITYDYKGGKVKKANPTTYSHDMTSDIILNAPEKKGYVFEGYFEKDPDVEEFTGEEIPVTKIEKGSEGDKTLYAKWRPISYTIIFKDTTGASYQEGVSDESIRQSMKYGDVLTFTDSYYEKLVYTLTSWTTKENGKGVMYLSGREYSNLTTEDGKEITVYANWKKDTYKITYILDGGKNHQNNPKKYNVDTTVTLKEPTKKGYTFDGWWYETVSENEIDGIVSENEIKTIEKGTITGDLELTAKWTPMEYNIVLYRNNNDYPSADVPMTKELSKIGYNTEITPSSWEEVIHPSELWKNKGIGILYWSTKADGSGKKYYPDQTYSGLATEGTVTLYAQWGLKSFAINYDYAGVDATGINNKNPKTFTYDADALITLKNITKTGYIFKGWYTDASFADEYKVANNEISRNRCEDITVYAWLEPISYTIKLNPNATDAATKENLVTEFTVEYGEDYCLEADAYTRAHYKFDYWTTKANGKGIKVTNGTINTALSTIDGATVNLYPKWELEKYTITYLNTTFEGEKVINKSPTTYTYSTKKEVELKNATRTGYVFGGWYNEDTTADDFDVTTSMRHFKIGKYSGGNIELYALWTPIKYNIQLNANAKDAKNGSVIINGENEKMQIAYGDAILLQRNSYIREGYNLVEFNTKKNGKGTSYALDNVHKIYTTKANSTIKLYAVWEKVETKKVSGVNVYTDGTQITVLFEENAGCTEYEVALSKSFTMSNAEIVLTNQCCVQFEDLESYTRYFVRFREVRYDSNGNKVYGTWSSIKSIKIGSIFIPV